MEQHINITLRLKEIREVDAIFNPDKKRKKYQLRIVNKGLLIDEGKQLSDYPMTTGDLVEIEEI